MSSKIKPGSAIGKNLESSHKCKNESHIHVDEQHFIEEKNEVNEIEQLQILFASFFLQSKNINDLISIKSRALVSMMDDSALNIIHPENTMQIKEI